MNITWLFSHTKTKLGKISPAIREQLLYKNQKIMCLRNPWRADSALMGKLYTSCISITLLTLLAPEIGSNIWKPENHNILYFFIILSPPLAFAPFLYYRVSLLKNLSDIYLVRNENRMIYQRYQKTIKFDWSHTEGGVFVRTEYGGSSFTTQYALALAQPRSDGTLHQKDSLWLDSNAPGESDVCHVAEVWEYMSHFMEYGSARLPPPGEPNWWHIPLNSIFLTPSEAWQHYVPWRTGEPGEVQGKKNWLLPFWLILFPYNYLSALCWYGTCKLFKIHKEAIPTELKPYKN